MNTIPNQNNPEHLTNIVVVALIVRDGKLFIAKRADTKASWPGRFELVGGHVDPGEALETALLREVKEELNVDVTIDRIIDAFTYESEDTFKVEICYLCHLEDGIEPQLNPDDHSEHRWIGRDEVDLFEKDDEEVQVAKKMFSILGGEQ